MGRPKGSKNKKSKVSAKLLELHVGDSIDYPKPIGGSEKVKIERIETDVEKICRLGLTKPETTLYLSNGRWMKGTDYLNLIGDCEDD